MHKIRKQIEELIFKYAEYRGALDERITVSNLLAAYLGGSTTDRRNYIKEMRIYIEAVDNGKIEKGLPLVVGELSS